jgi:hypothetical protein
VITESLTRRFWPKVNKSNGCWEWRGKLNESGYGILNSDDNKVQLRAHRLSYQIHYYPQTLDGLCVCHVCDNRKCVNPEHLFIGTRDDNNRDMREKGRASKPPLHIGENCHRAKLTANDVRTIRRLLGEGAPACDLAGTYNTTTTNIRYIQIGKTWKHLL